MNAETQKAVAELRDCYRTSYTSQFIKQKAESAITAFTAELEAAQREIDDLQGYVNEVNAIDKIVYVNGAPTTLEAVEHLLKQRDQAQAACKAKDEALQHCLEVSAEPEKWGRYLSKSDREIINEAKKLTCGTGFKSPAEYAALEQRYNELLYAVARAFPNESRHQTALRYIREAERSVLQSGADCEALEPAPRISHEQT